MGNHSSDRDTLQFGGAVIWYIPITNKQTDIGNRDNCDQTAAVKWRMIPLANWLMNIFNRDSLRKR